MEQSQHLRQQPACAHCPQMAALTQWRALLSACWPRLRLVRVCRGRVLAFLQLHGRDLPGRK